LTEEKNVMITNHDIWNLFVTSNIIHVYEKWRITVQKKTWDKCMEVSCTFII